MSRKQKAIGLVAKKILDSYPEYPPIAQDFIISVKWMKETFGVIINYRKSKLILTFLPQVFTIHIFFGILGVSGFNI